MREARVFPEAISHNVATLRRATPATEVMVVVKANGYGHGAVTAARAAVTGGATWLATADLTEALSLRHEAVTTPLLAWLWSPLDDVSSAIEQGIDIGVSSLAHLRRVAQSAHSADPAMVHLKVDSGLGRGGVEPQAWQAVVDEVVALQHRGVVRLRGVFSHLAGESAESDRAQAVVFDEALQVLRSRGVEPELVHLANSQGALRTPELSYDMVRIGIAAYGMPVSPAHETLGLRPAMRLSGQVILTKRLPAGHGVGYDHTYRTERETTVALLPLGYADGIPRSASSAGPVVLGGVRHTLAGRVSMDQVTVDIGDQDVRVGEWAVFWGDPADGEPSAMEWARVCHTISYELLTGVGSRVPRVVA